MAPVDTTAVHAVLKISYKILRFHFGTGTLKALRNSLATKILHDLKPIQLLDSLKVSLTLFKRVAISPLRRGLYKTEPNRTNSSYQDIFFRVICKDTFGKPDFCQSQTAVFRVKICVLFSNRSKNLKIFLIFPPDTSLKTQQIRQRVNSI